MNTIPVKKKNDIVCFVTEKYVFETVRTREVTFTNQLSPGVISVTMANGAATQGITTNGTKNFAFVLVLEYF